MDPERPIEKLLRQAAQARRDQADAPQELHPATRRMLQGEVARKFASGKADIPVGARTPERRSFFDWVGRASPRAVLLPRLAWGAAVFVGLGLAASLMLPRKNAPQQEMLLAKNDRLTTVETAKEAKTRVATPSEQPAPVTPRPDSSALAQANSARLADAERDKDSLSLERRRTESERSQPLAFNEPAPAPVPLLKREAQEAARQSTVTQSHSATATVGGSLAKEKQKEQLADAYSRAAPPQTPVAEESLAQRRYGLASAPQPAPSIAAPAAAGLAATSSATKLSDDTGKAELAYKSFPQQITNNATLLRLKLKSAMSADGAKRSPVPIPEVTQKFVQVAIQNKITDSDDKSAAAKPILVSFELKQRGGEVQIIDSDGSIYSGTFESPETFTYLNSAPPEKAAAARSLQSSEAPPERKDALSDSRLQTEMSFAFKVTGTNQTLKQTVKVTAEVLAPKNALSLLGPAGTVNGNRVAPPGLNPLPLQNSRISGKALIGTNQEVEVNAVASH
jgi:hypothetical protein